MPARITTDPTRASSEQVARMIQAYERMVIRQPGCWGWAGSTSSGAGRIKVRPFQVSALSVAWFIARRSWPRGEERVFRTCGGSLECTNPEHLAIGSKGDNARETIRRGATSIGTSVPADDRFWLLVCKGVEDECWEWQGSRSIEGYGHFNGPEYRAHRMAWLLSNGPINDGLYVLHRCDNPSCCNPAHLFLGTNKGNGVDMMEKGRAPRGEKSGVAKLTTEQVVEIRRMAKQGHTRASIAVKFAISAGHVSKLVNQTRWRHL